MTRRLTRGAGRVVAVGAILGFVLLAVVAPIVSAARRHGPSPAQDVDMGQLRHAVAVRCGLDEGQMSEPYLWAGGASWYVARTGARPGVSFGGSGISCG